MSGDNTFEIKTMFHLGRWVNGISISNNDILHVWNHNHTIFPISVMTSSKGNISALLVLCKRNSPVTGEFPSQSPVMGCIDVFFNLRMNKRLNNSSRRRWFEALSRSLCRHCNAYHILGTSILWTLGNAFKICAFQVFFCGGRPF